MSSIQARIEKLFPEEHFDDMGQDALIEKIRVPKNILYLSDRLPKPRYNDMTIIEAKKRKTGTFGDCSLPIIPASKSTGKKAKPVMDPYLEAILKPKENMKPYKIPKKLLSPLRQIIPEATNAEENPMNKSPSQANNSVENKEDSEEKIDNPIKLVPVHLKGMKQPRQIKKQQQRSNIIHQEYPQNEIRNNPPQIAPPEDDDLYIKQLVNKKNPLIRPAGSQLQRIAEIYTGGNAQNVIAQQKIKIDKILEMSRKMQMYGRVPQALLKGSYNISPYLQPAIKGIKPKPLYSIIGQKAPKLSMPSPLKANQKASIGYENKNTKDKNERKIEESDKRNL